MKHIFTSAALFLILISSGVLAQPGLLGCYPLDGNALDYSGNGYDGTIYNISSTYDRNGNFNQAVHFSGNLSTIFLPDSTFRLNAFTYSIWCKPSSLPSTGEYYSIFNDGGTGYNQAILLCNDAFNGNVGFAVASWDINYQPHSCNQGFLPTVNSWYHIVYTRDNNMARMYINNTLVCSSATGNAAAYSGIDLLASIGSRGDMSIQNFIGDIDELKIFNRVLTQVEIMSLDNMCPLLLGIGEHNPAPAFHSIFDHGARQIKFIGDDVDQIKVITLVDVLGQTVKFIPAGVPTIDAAELKNGLYLVNVLTFGGSEINFKVAVY